MIDEKLEKQFFSKIKKDASGCWNWIGCRGKKGYGLLSYKGKKWLAHRLSYKVHNGDFEKSLFVCHKCDNPPCVNPEHLFLGTCKDNAIDAAKKGRFYFPRPWLSTGVCRRRGHRMTKKNAYIDPTTGYRRCFKCMMITQKIRRSKNKGIK